MDDCTKEFIERNIELLDKDRLDLFYNNAESDLLNRKLIPGSIRELTLILKDVYGYEPLEHPSLHAVPSFYRILSDIDSFTIPNHIERIKGSAFKNCGRLTQITIPKSIVQIYDQVFLGCINLPSIYLSTELSYITTEAFAECDSIDIMYDGTKSDWKKIYIDAKAFRNTNYIIHCKDGDIMKGKRS